LIVLLVALIFWLGIKNTNIGNSLANAWLNIKDCVDTPTGNCTGS
jgi:hypothetical protein